MKKLSSIPRLEFALLGLILLSLAACEKRYDTKSRNENLDAELYPDNEIALTVDTSISPAWQRGWKYDLVPGSKQVAYYRFYVDPHREIADDEATYILLFEFDPDQSSFMLQDSALWRANCLFNQQCFCGTRGYYRISKGQITGEKLSDDTWSIDFDIRYDQFSYADSSYTEQQYRDGEIFRRRWDDGKSVI